MDTKKIRSVKGVKEFAVLIPKVTDRLGGALVPSLLAVIADYLESGEKGSRHKELYKDAAAACGILVNIFGDVRHIHYSHHSIIPYCQWGKVRS